MAKPIVWSRLAEHDYAGILKYLNENWDEKVVFLFLGLTENILRQISENPRQFPLIYKKRKIRKCVLTRHNTIFYRDNKTQIDILRVYDTRQDPEKLTFI